MYTESVSTIALDRDPDLGSLIRQARSAAGLTQGELARRMSTTQSAVSRWERGHEEPRLSSLRSIARACGLQLSLTITDDPVDRTQIRQQLALSPAERLQWVANVSSFVHSARTVPR